MSPVHPTTPGAENAGAENAGSECAATAERLYTVYRLFASVFIEADDGDKRFLRELSIALWGEADGYTLTIPHYWALFYLEQSRTMTELAKLLIKDKANTTAIVDKLEIRGWAKRVRGSDRRVTRVVLTPAGEVARRLVIEAHTRWVAQRFGVLDAAKLEQLATLLTSLLKGQRTNARASVADIVGPAQAQAPGVEHPPPQTAE
jgi:DNA-binding MarR family transcriptional regulator